MMRLSRFAATSAVLLAALLTVPAGSARASGEFPVDQLMLLDAPPIQKVKRMPALTVGGNGLGTLELWCRAVEVRVQLSGVAIRIETAPLPEALPQYMSSGQCSAERVQADNDLVQVLAQAEQWQRQGDRVLLSAPGWPRPIPFRLSSH
jgi:hypothetical protein